MVTIKRGVIKSFDPATYKATVQVEGSLFTWLSGVPVARSLGTGELVAGAKCGVLFFDESNPSDACIFATYEGVPAENIDNHSDHHSAGAGDEVRVENLGTLGSANTVPKSNGAGSLAMSSIAHSELTGISSDQHHAKSHVHDGVDGSGTVSYNSLTNKPTGITGGSKHGGSSAHNNIQIEEFLPAIYGDGTRDIVGGVMPAFDMADGLTQGVYCVWRVPETIVSLDSIMPTFIASGTGDFVYKVRIQGGGENELYNAHDSTSSSITKNMAAVNKWYDGSTLTSTDLPVMSHAATNPGLNFGISVTRYGADPADSIGAVVTCPGIKIKYTITAP